MCANVLEMALFIVNSKTARKFPVCWDSLSIQELTVCLALFPLFSYKMCLATNRARASHADFKCRFSFFKKLINFTCNVTVSCDKFSFKTYANEEPVLKSRYN